MGFRSGRVGHRDVTIGGEAGETQPALLTLKMEEEGHEPRNAATFRSWE